MSCINPSFLSPPLTRQATRTQIPGLCAALVLIALYFFLQWILGIVPGLFLGLFESFRQAGISQPSIVTQVMKAIHQPAVIVLSVVVALSLATGCVCYLVQRYWRPLCTLPSPPGLGLCRPLDSGYYWIAAMVFGLSLPLTGALLTQWLAQGHAVTQNVEQLAKAAPLGPRLALVVLMVSMGPLAEELLFRGVLLSALLRHLPPTGAVVMDSLLFSVMHLPGLYFQWYALPQLLVLALVLCWLRLAAGSLWPAMLAHGLYNAVAIWVLFGP